DVRTEVEHLLVVLGGRLVVAELQRRVAEQAVGARIPGVERKDAPRPLDRLLELMSGAVDLAETQGGGDVGGVERTSSLERQRGAMVVRAGRCLACLLHEGIAKGGPAG